MPTIICTVFIGGLSFQGLWVTMMEENCSLQSNMRSTRGRCSLNGWKTGYTWALGCQEVSTANSLALRHSASVRTGSTLLNNTWNQTSISTTLHHTHTQVNTFRSNLLLSRYKQHKTDFEVVPPERPLALPCQVRGCHCSGYQYVPRIGPNPVRCRCKHLPQDHSEATGYLCKKCESEITTFKACSLSR